MTRFPGRRSVWMGPVVLACVVSTSSAIDLDVTDSRIDAALAIARGSQADRTAFHAHYVFTTSSPVVESIEIITEFRRLVKIAETRLAEGDPFFARNTRAARDVIRPFHQRLSIVARVRFHPQNLYVVSPPIDVALLDQSAPVPRLEIQNHTLFGLASGKSEQQLPVFGATSEAVFDSTAVGQSYRTIVVRIEDKDVVRHTIDFGRLE